MKYEIKPKRLPTAKPNEGYTLTIFVEIVDTESACIREAKIQYPVENSQHGREKYRELRRMQRILNGQDPSSAIVACGYPAKKAVAGGTSALSRTNKVPVAV
ncbi:MAG: hypothetical protein VKJ64_01185 [Leptolyngbyaceae bacterium]|nr:hypothetical protein [Leptolyngbyaceae bacterium]